MTAPPALSAVVADGGWLAHRYDPEHDAVHFVRMSRDVHRAATFVTDEYLPAGLESIVLARQVVMDALPIAKAPHFIFHSAFCCSTLLARAFDIDGQSMGLKEPTILNDIIGWRQRGGGPPARVAQVLDQSISLLARPLAAGETIIIKPGNLTNVLARGILAMRKESKTLLLYAPLDIYLRSIAKKGMTGRLWVRDLLVKLLKEGQVDLGFTPEDYIGQTDLQVAAVGWLAQHAIFGRLATEFGPDRVRTLDSETLLAEPRSVIAKLGQLYGLDLPRTAVDEVINGPAFTRHSKFSTEFGADDRSEEYAAAGAMHQDELEKVVVWAQAVAQAASIPINLPNALL